MRDRIKKFMDFKGISASDFAAMLDVQRSNVSHILNGRNLPGAAFIEKLLAVFPELNARWLFLGKGSMISGAISELSSETKPGEIISPEKPEESLLKTVLKPSEEHSGPKVKEDRVPDFKSRKFIEKIVVMYSDKTFSEYRPE